MKGMIFFVFILVFLTSCVLPRSTPTVASPPQPTKRPTATVTATVTPWPNQVHSTPKFQVFILSPVEFCMAGNEYRSGGICRGEKCGDCDCAWEDYDPPAPVLAINPIMIDNPIYDQYRYKDCVKVTLTQLEIDKITSDMDVVKKAVFDWTGGALDLQMEVKVLPYDRAYYAGPDFVIGPAGVDDELLNYYVGTDTAFVYVVSGVTDRVTGRDLSIMCGGSYGEQTLHGAGFASIQYNTACASITIDSHRIYEPLIHEWVHNLDWALEHVHLIPDSLGDAGPDWAHWNRDGLPACGKGPDNPLSWFPSIDFCEWDPDWIDCHNMASSGCGHSGEVGGKPSWYEHVLSVHYPRDLQFTGNSCNDGRKDFGETGIDIGPSCP